MVIWKGKGLLVILALLVGTMLTSFLLGALPMFITTRWGYMVRGLVNTGLVAYLNYIFAKHFTDTTAPASSTLFFISNKNWTWVIAVIGTFMSILGSFLLS